MLIFLVWIFTYNNAVLSSNCLDEKGREGRREGGEREREGRRGGREEKGERQHLHLKCPEDSQEYVTTATYMYYSPIVSHI